MEEKILFNQLQTLTIEPGNGADFVLICGCPCADSLFSMFKCHLYFVEFFFIVSNFTFTLSTFTFILSTFIFTMADDPSEI